MLKMLSYVENCLPPLKLHLPTVEFYDIIIVEFYDVVETLWLIPTTTAINMSLSFH